MDNQNKFDYNADRIFRETSFNFFWWLCMKDKLAKDRILPRIGRKPLKDWTEDEVRGIAYEQEIAQEDKEDKEMLGVESTRQAVYSYVKSFLSNIYTEVEVTGGPDGITVLIPSIEALSSVTWSEVDLRATRPMEVAEILSRRLDAAIVASFKKEAGR